MPRVGYDKNGLLVSIPVKRRLLMDSFTKCEFRVKYLLGAKPKLGSLFFKESDCSGFVRWLVHEATEGVTTMPDGSYHQANWCIKQGFKKVAYKQSACMRDDRLRIAFIAPNSEGVGHVWLIFNGQTMESCGGRGVCRRPWSNKLLLSTVSSCFVLTDTLI